MPKAQLIDAGIFGSVHRYGDLGIHAVLDIRRTFSQAELVGALEKTVVDFPVLGCRYEPRFYRDAWVEAKGPLAECVHIEAPSDLEAATAAWTQRPVDPSKERPIRIVSLARPQGSRLIVSLSHMAVDGAGMTAVGHVLGSYLYGAAPALPTTSRRDLGPALGGLSWFHLPALARDVIGTLVQPLRVFSAAKRERPYKADGSASPTTRQIRLTAAQLVEVKARCGGHVSVNDLLIAAMARVSATRSSEGPVAVLYTMDLRRFAKSPRFLATNASSILSVVIARAATRDLASATAAVAEETLRHRKGMLGPAFLLVPIVLTGLTPHAAVRRILRAFHSVAVDLPLSRGLIVTNVGKVDQGLEPFAADLETMRIIGPNIRGVSIPAVVAFGFRGELHIELFAAPGLGNEALDEMEGELCDALGLGRSAMSVAT